MPDRQYLCIDQKSFYATVECVARGLDPMKTNLVVADPTRSENTICLAVSWKSIPPKRPNNLSTYLGKITRNLSFNRYKLVRAKKRGMGQLETALSELEGCVPARMYLQHFEDEWVLTNAIEAFLRKQSRIERNIFIGRYWYLYHIHDFAQPYQMSESKVTSLLFRMRGKLKEHLEKEGIFL